MKTVENKLRRPSEEERDFGRKEEEFFDDLEDLITFAKKYPKEKTKLLLLSPLPSPETNEECKDVFKNVCEGMKKLAQENSDWAKFLNLNQKFMPTGFGKIDLSLFSKDLIHLSPQGSDLLAEQIRIQLVRMLPKLK